MTESWRRVVGGVCALAVVWIGVYWWWPAEPRITFDAPEAAPPVGAAPRPAEVSGAGKPPPDGEPERVPDRGFVIPPRFRDYTVRDKDTFSSIAQRELGSSRHAAAISAANPFVDPNQLRAGRVIRIPLDPSNIQGRPVTPSVEPPPPESGRSEAAAAEPPAAPVDAVGVEYTVKGGDSLSSIAKAHYGSEAMWELIYRANRDVLKSRNELSLGQKLRLPPKP